MGASLAWGGPAHGSRVSWHERRDLYPHGVASGDPDAHSVLLWTRRPFSTLRALPVLANGMHPSDPAGGRGDFG